MIKHNQPFLKRRDHQIFIIWYIATPYVHSKDLQQQFYMDLKGQCQDHYYTRKVHFLRILRITDHFRTHQGSTVWYVWESLNSKKIAYVGAPHNPGVEGVSRFPLYCRMVSRRDRIKSLYPPFLQSVSLFPHYLSISLLSRWLYPSKSRTIF